MLFRIMLVNNVLWPRFRFLLISVTDYSSARVEILETSTAGDCAYKPLGWALIRLAYKSSSNFFTNLRENMRAGGKGASLARDFLRCLPKWNASQAMNSASGRVFTAFAQQTTRTSCGLNDHEARRVDFLCFVRQKRARERLCQLPEPEMRSEGLWESLSLDINLHLNKWKVQWIEWPSEWQKWCKRVLSRHSPSLRSMAVLVGRTK